jgi:hypothetical protein
LPLASCLSHAILFFFTRPQLRRRPLTGGHQIILSFLALRDRIILDLAVAVFIGAQTWYVVWWLWVKLQQQ